MSKQKFSVAIQTEGYQKLINNTLGDPEQSRLFIANISSAVASNPALQDCTPKSILSGALLGNALKLSPSPQLGQIYLVPFNNRKEGTKEAQFILGYKGYLQLAQRSGQYKKINVVAIKKGELVSYDVLTEEIEVNLIEDNTKREATATIGYYAMFEYLNGYQKTIYWSKEKMEAHAQKYSAGYKTKKGDTPWEKDFDSMAFKTMLRQLISKWGIMSIDLQTAFTSEGKTIKEDLTPTFVDMEDELETVTPDSIEEPKSLKDLQ